jgi:hypothetical protein
MKLNELMNSKIDYEVIKAHGGVFHTRAEIGGRIIDFSAIEEMDGEWEIAFGEKNGNGKTSYGLTGSGAAPEVLAMVKDSLLEFVERYQPEKMYFTADKDDDKNTRARVYERMIKRFNIPSYKYKSGSFGESIRFTLTKA